MNNVCVGKCRHWTCVRLQGASEQLLQTESPNCISMAAHGHVTPLPHGACGPCLQISPDSLARGDGGRLAAPPALFAFAGVLAVPASAALGDLCPLASRTPAPAAATACGGCNGVVPASAQTMPSRDACARGLPILCDGSCGIVRAKGGRSRVLLSRRPFARYTSKNVDQS